MPGLDAAARWRGASAALLTAALAVGAHAAADGAAPPGAGVALMIVLAATVGAFTASTPRARSGPGLFAVLSAGQLVGHVVLAVAGPHTHDAHRPPSPAMVAAHAAAVVVGAVLIAAGSRLCRALSTVTRVPAVPPSPPRRPAGVAGKTSDQPLQWMLLLAASVSHRGPPVVVLR